MESTLLSLTLPLTSLKMIYHARYTENTFITCDKRTYNIRVAVQGKNEEWVGMMTRKLKVK